MAQFSYAQKFTATYILGRYGYSAYDFLHTNPPITELKMINYTAGDDIKEVEANVAATEMTAHFSQIGIPLEATGSIERCQSTLAGLIKDGSGKAHELSSTIDANFRFDDEI